MTSDVFHNPCILVRHKSIPFYTADAATSVPTVVLRSG